MSFIKDQEIVSENDNTMVKKEVEGCHNSDSPVQENKAEFKHFCPTLINSQKMIDLHEKKQKDIRKGMEDWNETNDLSNLSESVQSPEYKHTCQSLNLSVSNHDETVVNENELIRVKKETKDYEDDNVLNPGEKIEYKHQSLSTSVDSCQIKNDVIDVKKEEDWDDTVTDSVQRPGYKYICQNLIKSLSNCQDVKTKETSFQCELDKFNVSRPNVPVPIRIPAFDFINSCLSKEDNSESECEELSTIANNSKKENKFSTVSNNHWPSSSWSGGSGRSAFIPYNPTTILTNLQRGNMKTKPFTSEEDDVTWYEQAGSGDLTVKQTKEPGIDINAPDENGLSALMWAAFYGQVNTVNMLISGGADVNYQGTSGETALLMAAAEGHIDVIKSLLSQNVDLDHADSTGNTALMYAAYGDHAYVVKELLLHGARFSLVNSKGDMAYSIALKRNCFSAIPVFDSHLLSLLQKENS